MNKVVLISMQGSGTNLLRAFLNSHDDVFIDRELLEPSYNRKINKRGLSDVVFLNQYFEDKKKENVVGFDLKYNQLNADVLNYIKDNNFFIIHLKRNAGRTFLRQINEFQDRPFYYEDVKKHVDFVKSSSRAIDEFIDNNNFHSFELYYEEMTLGKQIKFLDPVLADELCYFLQIESKKLTLSEDESIVKPLKIRY